MSMYSQYKSNSGYHIGDYGIDSYGVNHKNFSTRDELEYQFARVEREKQMSDNNKNGILYAQNNNQNVMSDATEYNFDDIYYSRKDDNNNFVYKGTADHEMGYSNRENDLGGPTNYGITQSSLNEYNLWNHPLKKGKNFPKCVEHLKPQQAKQILDEMYYQRYGINQIDNVSIARNVFDGLMNQGTIAGYDLASAVNEYKNTNFVGNAKVSQNLANYINSFHEDDIIPFNDLLSRKRMSRYFDSVDNHPKSNINNLRGWYNRLQNYYSNFNEFEKLYKDRVDDYIFNKYPQYYTGK